MRKFIILLINFCVLNVYAQKSVPVLLTSVYQHSFSDPSKKDIFKLALIGSSILKGKVLFEITTSDHRNIYSETFPATDLYGDLEEDFFTKKQRTDTIKKRFNLFFKASNFKEPAIDRKVTYSKYNDDNYDKVTFYDIKSDQSAIGFLYTHGYEGTYGIAWSKKQKKVVKYFYSD